MNVLKSLSLSMMCLLGVTCSAGAHQSASSTSAESSDTSVVVGAARTHVYVPLLQGKRIALLSNQTGMVGDRHVLDVMLDNGLDVVTIFSPEHGFRGKADAGEHG